jgi:uncharacterized protein YbjT (DUF2867 family)
MNEKKRILLTGATGYVGGKLLKELEPLGHEIHCLARNPDNITAVGPNTTVFQGDVRVRDSMQEAFRGVDTAYYLVHSLSDKHDFEQHEQEAAESFAFMARSSGVKRIIYLGGLGNEDDGLSPHLRSRQDVGRVLRGSGVPTIELRASIVLGAGSLSFEMIRALTEHLPFMVMPKWVSVKAQPIGIRDLLDYLIQSMDLPLTDSEVFEIGGTAARPEAADDSRTVSHPVAQQSLAGAGHAALCRRRPEADRKHPQPDHCGRLFRPRAVRY